MKRTNVMVDEELLENARVAAGERTYSGTINKALEELVRESRFRELLAQWEKLAAEGPIFREGYLEEIRPKRQTAVRERISANEKRAPRRKKKSTRDPR
ncbi:MAG TPA: type II toxin-antitoxin system VapB family antitoxin [Thermoanaerobaculia bacterium]|nr:type II toxin-antitoxin system VapB family antitoxin [Thermoanaerobaculia bacterium]